MEKESCKEELNDIIADMMRIIKDLSDVFNLDKDALINQFKHTINNKVKNG